MSDDGKKSTRQLAEEDFIESISVRQMLTRETGWRAESSKNELLGRNILHEEIGHFGTWDGQRYGFDQDTRDRLMAHTRQDVSATFGMAKSAFRDAHFAKVASRRAVLWMVLSVVLNIAILATLWFRP